MSEQTVDALDKAIRDHIADEDGGDYVAGWVLSVGAAMSNEPDGMSYSYMSPSQPLHVTLGLLDMAQRWFRRYDKEGE